MVGSIECGKEQFFGAANFAFLLMMLVRLSGPVVISELMGVVMGSYRTLLGYCGLSEFVGVTMSCSGLPVLSETMADVGSLGGFVATSVLLEIMAVDTGGSWVLLDVSALSGLMMGTSWQLAESLLML